MTKIDHWTVLDVLKDEPGFANKVIEEPIYWVAHIEYGKMKTIKPPQFWSVRTIDFEKRQVIYEIKKTDLSWYLYEE